MEQICKRVLLALLFFGLGFSPVFAQQNFGNYQPLQSSGQIPKDFLQLSSEKYKQEKAAISRNDKAFEKKAKKEFFLESSFKVHSLLYSGKVLFNDPIGIYVNQVADKLLANDPTLRSQIRIYMVKSPSVNAFATNSGMLFINVGLVAQLQTESQLAFILSHEITHYLKKHVVNQYVEDQKIEKGKNMYRALSYEDKMISRNSYSKELEIDADLDGLALFLKSNYSTKQLNGVFDILQYAYLPFDNLAFDKSFFESQHFHFPPNYFLDKVKAVAPPTEEDDHKSTHPSIEKRRSYVLEQVKDKKEMNKKTCLVSEEAFTEARKMARYELSYLYLSSLQYEKAIYNSYLLLQEDPYNCFLQKNVAKALYGLTKYSNEKSYGSVHIDEVDVEGNSQQVNHLFDKLYPKQLNALALKYTNDLKKKYPADKELATLNDDLLKSLVTHHCESEKDFSRVARPELKPILVHSSDSTGTEKNTKYLEIEAIKMKVDTEEELMKYILVDNFKDQAFAQAFDGHLKEKEKSKSKPEETKRQKKQRMKQERKERDREASIVRRKGEALGIDKIVMMNPMHAKIDQRKKKQLRYLDSENAELELNEQIQKNARLAKLHVELLSDNSFKSTDVSRFNDYIFLRGWIQERINHLDASVPMQNLDADYVQSLVNKYGTKYYCWTGFMSVREKKRGVAGVLFGTLVLYPLLPYGIYYAVTPKFDTYYYSLVFDITTGKPVFMDVQYINRRNSNDLLNSTMYNTFYQLKQRR